MRHDRLRWLGHTGLGALLAGCFTDPSSIESQSDGSGETSPGPQDRSALPCEVERVLREHCQSCHADPPVYGAPMPLVTPIDFGMPAPSDPMRSVHTLVDERIVDPARPMPPDGHLDVEDLEVLQSWLAAGMPGGEDAACDHQDEPAPTPVGPEALPCTPTHTFTAHADGNEDEPFKVPTVGADNLYACIAFRSPLAEGTQATAWAPIIDDARVVHHWILYRTQTPQVDGAAGPCNMPSDSTFVAGWAPGGQNFIMPDDVGLELGGPDDWFILQMHYHNAARHDDAYDRSGVALCTSDAPRPKTAGIFTLGSVAIDIPAGAQNHTVSGTCPGWITAYLPEPVDVIASFPHMHELGRSLRTDILRGGATGAIEPLVEVPSFNFENQKVYPHSPSVQIRPGDAIRTTCTYDNTHDFDVTFGEATEDEMCFNFVMVYPIEILGEDRHCGLL